MVLKNSMYSWLSLQTDHSVFPYPLKTIFCIANVNYVEFLPNERLFRLVSLQVSENFC
jgi:hypothetical protein